MEYSYGSLTVTLAPIFFLTITINYSYQTCAFHFSYNFFCQNWNVEFKVVYQHQSYEQSEVSKRNQEPIFRQQRRSNPQSACEGIVLTSILTSKRPLFPDKTQTFPQSPAPGFFLRQNKVVKITQKRFSTKGFSQKYFFSPREALLAGSERTKEKKNSRDSTSREQEVIRLIRRGTDPSSSSILFILPYLLFSIRDRGQD